MSHVPSPAARTLRTGRPWSRRAALVAVALLPLSGLAACGGGSVAAPGTSSAPTATPTAPGVATSSASPSPAGNGVQALPAKEAMARAKAALAAGRDVHVKGAVVSGKDRVGVDLRIAKPGSAVGSVSQNGTRIDLVILGPTVYLGGNDAFWKQVGGAAAVRRFRGKYFRTTSKDKRLDGVRDLTDLRQIAATFLPADELDGDRTGTASGRPARVLEDGAGGTYAIATTGPAYPLALHGGDATARIDLDFTYDAKVAVTPPPAAKVVPVGAVG